MAARTTPRREPLDQWTDVGHPAHWMAFGRSPPRCPRCSAADIDVDQLAAAAANGRCFCPGCGAPVPVRPADALTAAWNPYARLLVGEAAASEGRRAMERSAEPVVVACMKCGGGLSVDGSTRAVACPYCRNSNYLPDALWQHLNPVPKPAWFFVVCEYPEAALLELRWWNDEWMEEDSVREDLSAEQLARLARSSSWEVRRNVANHRTCPPEVLAVLAQDHDTVVLMTVAANPHTPAAVIRSLASHEDDEVAAAAAAAAAITPEALEILAGHEDYDVRAAAARSPLLSAAVMLRLALDTDADVRRALVDNPSLTRPAMQLLSRDANEDVQVALARRGDLPDDVLEVLAASDQDEVRKAVLASPGVPGALVDAIAISDGDRQVRVSAAAHPLLSHATLRHLLRDEDRAVAAAARERCEALKAEGIDVFAGVGLVGRLFGR